MIKNLVRVTAISSMLFLFLAACAMGTNIGSWGSSGDDKTKSGKGVKLFGATYMTMNNPFFVKLDNGIKTYVEENGDKLVTLDPELDNQKQISCVGELVSKGADLIFLNPADSIGIKPALEVAKKSKVPIIVVDAPVFNDELVASTVASDNYSAGVLCARDVINKLGSNASANIVILEHPAARSAVDRIDGFEKEISRYPGMKIVDRRASDGQLELAMAEMEQIIEKNKKIDVVMSLNDPTAIGAIAAMKAKNRLDGVLVYGVDGSDDAMKLIKSGEMTATVSQSPEKIGRIAVESAYKLLSGETIPHDFRVEVRLVDKTNVGYYLE